MPPEAGADKTVLYLFQAECGPSLWRLVIGTTYGPETRRTSVYPEDHTMVSQYCSETPDECELDRQYHGYLVWNLEKVLRAWIKHRIKVDPRSKCNIKHIVRGDTCQGSSGSGSPESLMLKTEQFPFNTLTAVLDHAVSDLYNNPTITLDDTVRDIVDGICNTRSPPTPTELSPIPKGEEEVIVVREGRQRLAPITPLTRFKGIHCRHEVHSGEECLFMVTTDPTKHQQKNEFRQRWTYRGVWCQEHPFWTELSSVPTSAALAKIEANSEDPVSDIRQFLGGSVDLIVALNKSKRAEVVAWIKARTLQCGSPSSKPNAKPKRDQECPKCNRSFRPCHFTRHIECCKRKALALVGQPVPPPKPNAQPKRDQECPKCNHFFTRGHFTRHIECCKGPRAKRKAHDITPQLCPKCQNLVRACDADVHIGVCKGY
ncbi:hypothetical protein KIPB_009407 [Kipferlia bialata]|uniref:Uncharacterized protein n=1 Tax=Kipferlia bialata TaxID=797122 RepID=A0A9K3D290_9EUKA|nr:hypothetical protein KIPB_009407 [Kipferlia bialata]|eukprot:g9407.t1